MEQLRKPISNPIIVLREEFDDWAILFDPDSGSAFGLNPTGVQVWKLLNGERTPVQLLEQLAKRVDQLPDSAGEDLSHFLGQLEEQGLVGYEILQAGG